MATDPTDATVEAVARAIYEGGQDTAEDGPWDAQADVVRAVFSGMARDAISAHLAALKAQGMVIVPANSVKRWLGLLPRSELMKVFKK